MRICTFQVPMSSDIAENVNTIARCLNVASTNRADLVVFPEMMMTGYDQHLHDFFRDTTWYERVLNGLESVKKVVLHEGVKALVGTPYRQEKGYHNAILLFDPEEGMRYAGGRMIVAPGWYKWGFTVSERKDPVFISSVPCGFVICNEVGRLDEFAESGIENSKIIFWPSITRNHLNDRAEVIKNNSFDGATSIAKKFGALVVQSSYISQIRPLGPKIKLGGIVIADAGGTVLQQAPYDGEAFLIHDFA